MEPSDQDHDPRPGELADQIAALIEDIEQHLDERTEALFEEE